MVCESLGKMGRSKGNLLSDRPIAPRYCRSLIARRKLYNDSNTHTHVVRPFLHRRYCCLRPTVCCHDRLYANRVRGSIAKRTRRKLPKTGFARRGWIGRCAWSSRGLRQPSDISTDRRSDIRSECKNQSGKVQLRQSGCAQKRQLRGANSSASNDLHRHDGGAGNGLGAWRPCRDHCALKHFYQKSFPFRSLTRIYLSRGRGSVTLAPIFVALRLISTRLIKPPAQATVLCPGGATG